MSSIHSWCERSPPGMQEKMKFLVSIVVLLTLSQSLAEKVRFDNHKLYRLIPKDEKSLIALKELQDVELSGYDFWSYVKAVGVPVDIMVSPHLVKELQNMVETLGIDSEVLMENVQEQIDNEGLRPQSRAGTFDWTSYHTYDEYNTFLQNVVSDYPSIATLFQAGESYEGRAILGVKLSYSSANEDNAIFVESGIHAREWITGAVSTYILNELLTSSDPAVRNLAESYDWYFVPIFNPDGFVYTHTNVSTF
ncbi:hypothetical protein NQ314_019567 [Rhamnusium bicolor]|uniref:Zinc carboxypeptidase A 1 n=1 Tax=Rhamnusium bicolor TaxID=1586634 RepID=A0AAV8WP41_9CUCU|nr:hypothetical protein NQ314_019567 [Rhamnusium bicolor]